MFAKVRGRMDPAVQEGIYEKRKAMLRFKNGGRLYLTEEEVDRDEEPYVSTDFVSIDLGPEAQDNGEAEEEVDPGGD